MENHTQASYVLLIFVLAASLMANPDIAVTEM